MSIGNTWMTGIRTERKKKRSYAEVFCNLKEVKVNNIAEEKTLSSQQRVNILENFSDIYRDLLRDEERNSPRIVSPPKICVNTLSSCNNSNQNRCINTSAVFDSQDQDILNILEEL